MLALAKCTLFTRYNVRMWCNAGHRHDRGPLIGITFTWGARFLIQRKKIEDVLELHGIFGIEFPFYRFGCIILSFWRNTLKRGFFTPPPCSFLVYLTIYDFFFLSFHDLKQLRSSIDHLANK